MRSLLIASALAALPLSLAALTADQAAQVWAQLAVAPTEVDRINILSNDGDFVFNFLDPTATRTTGAGGFIVSANAGTFPATFGNGMAMGQSFFSSSFSLPTNFPIQPSVYWDHAR